MKRTTTLMTGVATAALTVTTALPAFAAGKWDMPMAYSASNFHSENGVESVSYTHLTLPTIYSV